MVTNNWHEREVAFILYRREVVNIAPVVIKHTESHATELF